MGMIEAFMWRASRVSQGLDTWEEFFCRYLDRAAEKFFKVQANFYYNAYWRRKTKPFTSGKTYKIRSYRDMYKIRDVKLPLLNLEDRNLFLTYIFSDTFISYVYFDDKYDEKTFDICDPMLQEGLYGLVNDSVNVTVKPGDIVIDAGSWIGDFAAYASAKGAKVYAFEPTEKTFTLLKKTAELNGNIYPINKGLSDENTNMKFFECIVGNTGANSMLDKTSSKAYTEAVSSVETIRLDDFVRENNLPRVDFIKCDIEGFERHMLAGAQETLKNFAPKLALCTYHLKDDPQVMAELILKANPKYNIVQKRMKLFASVPE